MRVVKPAKAYEEFLKEIKIDLGFTPDQSAAYDRGESILLSKEQLDFIVDQLSVLEGIDSFLIRFTSSIQPISLSLFVLNDKLWKIMERKLWDPEKMLAMSTIPLCAWDKNSESISNTKAVKRWTVHPSTFAISFGEYPKMSITGEGGDFSGFIDQSQLTARKFGIPESRKEIPNYIFDKLDIKVELDDYSIETYPKPRDDLDYDYSDHARVFYEHGFAVSLPGENVTLKVGKRKPAKMLGEVYLLIGRRVNVEEEPFTGLLLDIWLRAFQRRMEG